MEKRRSWNPFVYTFFLVVVLMKWILSTVLVAWLRVNSKVALRVFLGVAIFFAIELIYSKFLDPELGFGEGTRTYILIVYSLIQFSIILWVLFALRYAIWGKEKVEKAFKAKESFKKMPKNLEDLSDISKYPDL